VRKEVTIGYIWHHTSCLAEWANVNTSGGAETAYLRKDS
jgi:hypothetical protein